MIWGGGGGLHECSLMIHRPALHSSHPLPAAGGCDHIEKLTFFLKNNAPHVHNGLKCTNFTLGVD